MESNNSNGRRDFVKQSTLLAGSLMAAPILSNANYFSGADDVIKIALVGCGGRWAYSFMFITLISSRVLSIAKHALCFLLIAARVSVKRHHFDPASQVV